MESLGLESSGSYQGPGWGGPQNGVQASCTSNKALKSGAPIIMGSEGAVFV